MKTIAVLSGGMDSTTMVAKLLYDGDEVKCITFDYGQRHRKEIEAAKTLCARWCLEQRVVDLSDVGRLLKNNSQTGDVTVPHGHYEEENMRQTVVPNRNMIMLSIAVAWAIDEKADRVAYGAHAGDHAIYPDCRESFVLAIEKAILLADWHKVSLYVPFLSMHKGEIAALGKQLGVPYELTWTCYEGGSVPCLKCGACQERLEAMEFART